MFEEIFFYLIRKDVKGFKYPKTVEITYKKNEFINIFIGKFLSLFNSRKKSKYVFLGSKYKDLILGLKKKDVLILGGFKQLIFCLIYRLPFSYIGTMYSILNDAYTKNKNADDGVEIATRLLLHVSAKVLIVVNDSLPMERIWICAARKTSLISVCIQHGLFQSTNPNLLDGRYTDIMLVYDINHLNIMAKYNILNTRILGYHSNVTIDRSIKPFLGCRVCILGQPYINYYEGKDDIYLSQLNILINLLRSNNISYAYKPHPSEKGSLYLNNLKPIYNHNLSRAFKEFEIFISFTSTALLEASLHKKVSIQIYHEGFGGDNFEEIGYAYSVTLDDSNRLLHLINMANPISNSVLDSMIYDSIEKRFHHAISSIN